ncbi:MAG: hypothetical protein ABGZ37_14405, partial [Akkermansiaceae bacterium]
MKKLAFVPAILVLVFTFSSCCYNCVNGKRFGVAGFQKEYVEYQETEWIEEDVHADPGAKGSEGGTVTVRRPIVKTIRKAVTCTSCGSWYCAAPACCDITSTAVLRRATAQGGSGEPHIGQSIT